MHVLPLKTLLALLPFFLQASAQASGTGTTTRYWDCCKPSCSWPGKITLASGSNPVGTCDANDNPLADYNAASGCGGGSAYMCSGESPWAVSDTLSYGYAAVNIAGGSESSWCCACYELTFTSGAVAGKTMIVQATNTGGDLGANHFDLAIPGGGFGIFNGCTPQYGTPAASWGAQYGGISSRSQCDSLPDKLRDGCYWRYGWFQNADNPAVSYKQVICPAALTAKTGCVRADDSIPEQPTGPAVVATWNSGGSLGGTTSSAVATTTAAAESSPSSLVSPSSDSMVTDTFAPMDTSTPTSSVKSTTIVAPVIAFPSLPSSSDNLTTTTFSTTTLFSTIIVINTQSTSSMSSISMSAKPVSTVTVDMTGKHCEL